MKLAPKIAMVACALALAACAGENDERDSLGSSLYQPPHGAKRPPPIEAGDIAIVGQDAANDILQLPQIANASTPPLVRFSRVTSIINPPIDTAPYTELFRDRLLLLTREKLRFVERTLPLLHAKHSGSSTSSSSDAQYEVLAEMRGRAEADTYKIQIEFVEIGTGTVLFNQTYRIAKEEESQPSAEQYTPPMAPQPQQQPAPKPQENSSSSQTPGPGYYYPPPPATNNGSGNAGVL